MGSSAQQRIGATLLLAALVTFVLTARVLDPEHSTYRALGPWPDGPEYVDAGRNWAETGSLRIHVAGELLPARYPPGYSVLLGVAMNLGAAPLDAPIWVNRAAALLTLGLVWLELLRRGLPLEAGLAVFLLSTRTAFVIMTRAPMSELVSGIVLLAAVFVLYEASKRTSKQWAAFGGFLLGLSLCFRVSNLLWIGFLPAAAYAAGGSKRSRSALLLAGIAGWTVGAAALATYQQATFGNPLATGYGFWLGNEGAWSGAFAFEHVPGQLAMLGRELLQIEDDETTAGLYGAGSYLAPAFALAAALALWRLRRNRRLAAFAAAACVYALAMLSYFFFDFRLYYPLVLFAVPVTVAGLLALYRDASRRAQAAMALLLLGTLSGWPGRRSAFDLGDMLRTPSLMLSCPEWESVDPLNTVPATAPRLILTDMNPPYVHAMTNGERIAAPLEGYGFNPKSFSFDEGRRRELVRRAFERGDEVWVVTRAADIAAAAEAEASLHGASSDTRWTNGLGGGAARLIQQ